MNNLQELECKLGGLGWTGGLNKETDMLEMESPSYCSSEFYLPGEEETPPIVSFHFKIYARYDEKVGMIKGKEAFYITNPFHDGEDCELNDIIRELLIGTLRNEL